MGDQVYVEGAVSAIQWASKAGNGSRLALKTSDSDMSPTDVEKIVVIETEDVRIQQCWDKTKRTELGNSNHYTSIAALIVHWADELDKDLNTAEEVCRDTSS